MKTKRLLMAMVLFAQALYAAQWLDPETGIFWQYTFGGNGDEAWIGNCNNDPTKWLYAAYPLPQGDIEIPTELGGVLVKGIGHYAFNNCSNLTSVTIRPGVDNIRDVAFYNCEKLKSVTIPEGVTNIGERAFEYCTNLTSVTIPSSVSRIKMETFHNCFGLKSATISEGVTSIEPRAFCCCEGLVSLLIPSSMKSIGWMAFFDCQSLRSLTIPEGVTNVGESAFSNCYGLESVSIPESLANIGSGAFAECRVLTRVYVAKGDEVRVKEMLAASGLNVDELTFVEMVADGGPYKETVDGIEWTYTVSNGNGSVVSISAATVGAITIPSILGGHPVTSIGDWAFGECSGLTSVVIPSSVTSIYYTAFYGCSGLTAVTIPACVKELPMTFPSAYDKIKEVVVLDNVTSIGDSAFQGCSGLTSVTMPSSVTSIGHRAFSDCWRIESVTIPSSVTSIGAGAFSGCGSLTKVCITDLTAWCGIDFADYAANPLVEAGHLYIAEKEVRNAVVPEGVTSINDFAFYNCSGLTAATIPSSVTSIGDSAFQGCSGLTSVTIPSSVTSIGDSAFQGCSGLTSVTMPSSVTSIGDSAFQGCSGLTLVTIPSGVASIGHWAFSDCRRIESVTIPSSVTSVGDHAFYGCSGLKSVAILSSVTSVGQVAFYGCSSLTSVTIPTCVKKLSTTFPDAYMKIREVVICDGVTSIGSCLFEGCREVTSVTIPSSVTSIGSFAFSDTKLLNNYSDGLVLLDDCLIGCKGICTGELVIPDGVRLIGGAAFYNCSGLTSVAIPSSVTSVGDLAFYNCSGLARVDIRDLAAWCEIDFATADANPLYYAGKLYLNGQEIIRCLEIPNGVEKVGLFAFYNCGRVMSVTIPSSVTSIGDSAFQGCSGLTAVTIPSNVMNIGCGAFAGCTSVKAVTMPGRFALTNVFSSGCFSMQDMLIEDVTILAGEKDLRKEVFAGCSGVKTIVISEGVMTLGEDLFYNFRNLRELTIPSTVTSIGGYALNGCSVLKTIHVSGNGDVDILKQMLYESGFDTTGVTFDRIVYCKVKFDPQGGVAEWTEAEVREGMPVGGLPAVTCDGYEFLGWFTAASGGTKVTAATVVTENMTLYAHWAKSGEESVEPVKPPVDPPSTDPAIVCNIKAEYRTKTDIGVIPVEVVNVGEAVKIAVKGLPSGVKFTAKDIVDRKTKKVMVPANSIYGTPTKSGVYAATVTVTPTDRKSKMTPIVKTLTFVVRNAGEHIVRADCDAAQGSVKGMGVYAPGKKVTLKATAVKGWVFSGWRSVGESADNTDLASWSFTMPNKDVKVLARFVTVAEDKGSIGATVDGFAFGSAAESGGSTVSRDVMVKQGMYVEWPVVASALSATTVKVSGLPSGLKFTAKDVMKKGSKTEVDVPANTIYGTPKTASKTDKNGNVTPSKVKITVTTAGKAKQEYVLTVTVRGIPAEGTFNGGSASGLVTLTVAKTGKISGKYLADGKTWTLSAAGFDTWDDNDRMTATLTAKSGKEVKTVALVYEDGYFSSPLFEAWRNEWKTEPQKSLAATLKGLKVTVGEDDNIVLTVGSNGAVTAKGTFGTYSASCSTVLIPTESKGTYVVYLYFPPKAGKFDGWVGTAYITAE